MLWHFDEFGFGPFGALCKISDVNIFKRLLLPQFSFNFNQTLLQLSKYVGHEGIQAVTIFGDLSKI